MRHTREYQIWVLIKQRCYNPKYRWYPKYGGAGIGVCDEWRSSFVSFYADIGPRPSTRHTLARVDETKDFSPENCRWVRTRRRTKKGYSLEPDPLQDSCVPFRGEVVGADFEWT